MELRNTRRWYHEHCTIGLLTIDGVSLQLFILEDKMREVEGKPVSEWKIPHVTAIPVGRFRLTVDYSTRFKRYMLHLLDVPGYEGVRVHSGNVDTDTDGCLLTGSQKGNDSVLASKAALEMLISELCVLDGWDSEHNCQKLRMKEETWITVENGAPIQGEQS